MNPYKRYKVGLLVGLLGFHTFSSYVHTRGGLGAANQSQATNTVDVEKGSDYTKDGSTNKLNRLWYLKAGTAVSAIGATTALVGFIYLCTQATNFFSSDTWDRIGVLNNDSNLANAPMLWSNIEYRNTNILDPNS